MIQLKNAEAGYSFTPFQFSFNTPDATPYSEPIFLG